MLQVKRTRSITAASSQEATSKRRKTIEQVQQKGKEETLPAVQSALKLHAIRQPYEVSADHLLPSIQHDSELLVKVQAVGLNPIDWKAPDYNFGIPTLPYISGREYSGAVLLTPKTPSSRIKKGDRVLVPSTDYRDPRKAAYQHYSIASTFNTIRLPPNLSLNSGSILGVAFVSAALTLGICLGLDFSDIEDGPNILDIVRRMEPEGIPGDIRQECFHSIGVKERIKAPDNLIIWGAGSRNSGLLDERSCTSYCSGFITGQIADSAVNTAYPRFSGAEIPSRGLDGSTEG
ncbi:hypothetical protein J4E93_003297 [Alternaria ventricosa]|uniref:uncharacterized protein n=1 Tax=Alternaria ventricosa TaxID=1187951 RepID=UPI0020C3AEB1|nr:uncharacterized protein J4E93_003297 [Alternaria ventricosa]KAI4650940.1 hypothetical protein J4E93_003297 [Alternaria ventricosa]